MMAGDLKKILTDAWENSQDLMDYIFSRSVDSTNPDRKKISDPNMFFIESLPVIPSRFRPPQMVQGRSGSMSLGTEIEVN